MIDRETLDQGWRWRLAPWLEVAGPGINLVTNPARGPLALIDVVILLDGLVRLCVIAVERGPAGSLFGLALVPLYRRRLR